MVHRILRSLLSTLLGGYTFLKRNKKTVIINSFILGGLILFFELFFYLDTSRNANLIGCGCVIGLFFLIKLVLYFFTFLLKTSLDISVSEASVKEDRPEHIPPEIWELRSILRNPNTNIDATVSDLIATGVEVDGVLKLVEYLQTESGVSVEISESDDDQNPVINICGRLYTLPFSRNSIGSFFPATFSFDILIFIAAFGFASAYLPLSLKDQFLAREKWWVAIVCATSTYSILIPPETDPYITFSPDPWTCVARPFAISIVSTLWRVFLRIEQDYSVTKLPFYDIEINWAVWLPYIFDILKYSILLLPFWVVIGFVGHPLSVFVAILEAACRYLFGQNGVKGKLHLAVQILRGAASVACCWALLNHEFSKLYLSFAIAIATFINTIPLYFNVRNYRIVLISYGYSFLLAILSFVCSYCIVYLPNNENKQKIILWFSFGWFLAIDVVLPYTTSCNPYFLLHFQIFNVFPGIGLIRDFSQLIVGPLFISACLLETSFHPLLLAFIIVHATQKCNSEPHIFALAVIMTVMLFPKDLGYYDYSINLLLSLLFSSKLEIVYHVVNLTYRSRNVFELGEIFSQYDEPILNLIGSILACILEEMPASDFVFKIPSMIWCSITGASFTCHSGSSFWLSPGPLRPFYFFDFPIKTHQGSFLKNSSEYPIETPIYSSACRTFINEFSRIARFGCLGYVSAGDIFLFKAEDLMMFVHVISIESSVYRIQCRGLEYNSTTICHSGEAGELSSDISNYSLLPNYFMATKSKYRAFDLQAIQVSLLIYDVNRTNLTDAFLGCSPRQIYEIFLGSYCYIIATQKDLLFEIPLHEEIESTMAFTTNCSERIEQLVMARLAALNLNQTLSPEESSLAKVLWLSIVRALFNQETSSLNYQILVDAYKGNIQFDDSAMWIYNTSTLLSNIVIPSIRLGCAACYLENALPIDFDENDQCSPETMIEFIEEVESTFVIADIDAQTFETKFYNKEKKSIFALENVQGKPYIIRFYLNTKVWSVFRVKPEWARALWSGEARTLLFYLNTNEERSSIQQNDNLLNNLILQSADSPIGYPAYLSDILDSPNNPFAIKVVNNDE